MLDRGLETRLRSAAEDPNSGDGEGGGCCDAVEFEISVAPRRTVGIGCCCSVGAQAQAQVVRLRLNQRAPCVQSSVKKKKSGCWADVCSSAACTEPVGVVSYRFVVLYRTVQYCTVPCRVVCR